MILEFLANLGDPMVHLANNTTAANSPRAEHHKAPGVFQVPNTGDRVKK